MDNVQQIQESQYSLPYHWSMSPNEYRGRKYFGYTNLCIKQAKKHGLDLGSSRILDAGTGDARFVRMLIENGAASVEGTDYSDKALAFARILLPEVNFFKADLTDLSTLDGLEKYEAVFLIETLEHIPVEKVDVVLKNLKQIIKNDGLLIITVPSVRLPLHDKHYQHFSSDSLSEYLSKHFEVVEIVGYATTNNFLCKYLYKLFDNRLWSIKPLTKLFNKTFYPKYCLECDKDKGEGILAVAKIK